MTPFRNDASNPFDRESLWPRLPQTPLELGARTRAAMEAAQREADDDGGDLEFEPVHETALEVPGAVLSRARRGLRPVPFLVASAVGVAGLTTLYLVIGLPF